MGTTPESTGQMFNNYGRTLQAYGRTIVAGGWWLDRLIGWLSDC